MDETRDRAYLQLIHALLNCPNGEEPQILQEHLELLDSGFLETCKLVASTLAAQGGKNDANYLVNLASKLAEFMDESNPETENPQEYSNFILELLQAEQDSGGDIKVIYPMLAQRQYLLNLRFAETLQQVVQRFLAEHPETVGSILHDVENLSIDISKFPCGNRMKKS
ncbi:MAG: hypothetical protein HC849_20825 [Oscillatoriales cyanobacterium RU_3_3]|nr:hypothetical protein [Oscillatoriales cyanobacterium RU_3_3]